MSFGFANIEKYTKQKTFFCKLIFFLHSACICIIFSQIVSLFLLHL